MSFQTDTLCQQVSADLCSRVGQPTPRTASLYSKDGRLTAMVRASMGRVFVTPVGRRAPSSDGQCASSAEQHEATGEKARLTEPSITERTCAVSLKLILGPGEQAGHDGGALHDGGPNWHDEKPDRDQHEHEETGHIRQLALPSDGADSTGPG